MAKTRIKFDRHNYRRHSDENKKLINQSLAECGAGRSVLVDAEGELIAGNGVYEQAQKLGIPTRVVETDGTELVVVKRTDLATADAKRKKLAAMDNATADKVEWNIDALQTDFSASELAGMSIEVPGIETGGGTNGKGAADVHEDNFDEATDAIPKRCARGDVWQLGLHRLVCGDSTNLADMQKLMQGAYADMVFTDPPYGVNTFGGRRQTAAKRGIKQIENDALQGNELQVFLQNFLRVMQVKEGASVYVCYPWQTQKEFTEALRGAGLKFQNCIIWDKKVFGTNGHKGYRPQYEMVYFCSVGDTYTWYGDMAQSNIWQISREIDREAQGNHPTPKPVALVGKALNNSSKRGDIVVDMFCGCGTTLIACEQTGRACYAMELDEHYCDTIIARWEKLTGQKAIKQ